MRLNLESAARAIELYADMLGRNFITWTRNYFQTIFTAGISIIHCLSFGANETEWHVADADRFWPVLNSCSDILAIFKREMPDASTFTIIFRETLKHLAQKRPMNASNTDRVRCQPSMSTGQPLEEPTGDQLAPSHWYSPETTLIFDNDHLGSYQFDGQDTFLSEDIMQSLEEGLGQYACGFPGDDPFNFELSEFGF